MMNLYDLSTGLLVASRANRDAPPPEPVPRSEYQPEPALQPLPPTPGPEPGHPPELGDLDSFLESMK